jgi:hypothetical protein
MTIKELIKGYLKSPEYQNISGILRLVSTLRPAHLTVQGGWPDAAWFSGDCPYR